MYLPTVIILLSIVLAGLIIVKQKHKSYKHTKETDQEQLALDLSIEELNKTLNFMLMYGVITFDQYNKIQLKSLPYVK